MYNVICISVTWFSHEKLDLIQFNGYKFASSYCRRIKPGGGVCILLQNHLDYTQRNDITDMSIEYVLELCATELPNNLLIIVMY